MVIGNSLGLLAKTLDTHSQEKRGTRGRRREARQKAKSKESRGKIQESRGCRGKVQGSKRCRGKKRFGKKEMEGSSFKKAYAQPTRLGAPRGRKSPQTKED
eukprot:1161942-Pelagomonas_calceolata.AAC.5